MMKRVYIGTMLISSLLAASCATDSESLTVDPTEANQQGPTEASTTALALSAQIESWQEDESMRALSWDITDPTASDIALAPKVRYTQQEFNGQFAPSELITNPSSRQTDKYWTAENKINPDYTEISIKLRRPYKTLGGVPQSGSPQQLRYTIWNGRILDSSIKEGRAVVAVSNENGKQSLELYLPLAAQGSTRALFDGEWYAAIALGGHSGTWNTEESMSQFYGPSATATIQSLFLGTSKAPLNAYLQFGSAANPKLGDYPAFTEPNRLKPTKQGEYAQLFGLTPGSKTNPGTSEAIRRGLGLQEQVAPGSTLKRHFPMISRFHQVTGSKRNQWSAAGDNSSNYAQVKDIIIEPRGTILAFRLRNNLSVPIRVQSIIGNHGGVYDGYQADSLPNNTIVLKQRSYKAISYQGFYQTGWTGNAEYGGFPEADMKAGKPSLFVGMSTGPEEFPLYAEDGTASIVLQPGQSSNGRFYLWFSADPGAEFKIRMKYDELDANNTATSSGNLSKPQKVNPARGINFEEGKVYGALISVKPN
ncbi:MAG: hypothetical protein SOW66_05740 [Porphyromonas sp.]|nr:hypothetical protein [Porphyromonas sp.]